MQLIHYGHSCVLLDTGSARLLFDPGSLSTGFEELRELDGILVTHQHLDHVDPERLATLAAANPQAKVIIDPGSVDEVAKVDVTAQVVQAGASIELGGAVVHVVGGDHAMIHPDVPIVPNVGYVVDHGAFYHPGDSLFVPEQRIDVLGLPAGAPWMKLAEAIDFERAVAPRVAVPIHQALLSEIGATISYTRLGDLAPEGTRLRVLTPLEPAEV